MTFAEPGLGDLVESNDKQDNVGPSAPNRPQSARVLHIDPARTERPAGRAGP